MPSFNTTSGAAPARPNQPLRLLLLEDSPDDAILIVRELSRGGFTVNHNRIQSEPELRSCLESETWDLIIADYSMPQFTGLMALQIVRDLELQTPFLLVSGTVGEEIAVNAMQAGASDYLLKDRLTRLAPAALRALRDHELELANEAVNNALAAEQERTRDVMANIPGAVCQLAVTPQNHLLALHLSEGWTRLAGQDPTTATGPEGTFSSCIQVDDLHALTTGLQHASPTPGVWNGEFRILDAQGQTKICQIHCRAHASPGRALVWNGVITDITHRREMEHALAQSEGLFRQLAESIDQVFRLGSIQPRRILYVSPAFERLWGFPVDHVLQNPDRWLESIHPEDLDRTRTAFDDWISGLASRYEVEFRVRTADGLIRWIAEEGAIIRNAAGQPERFSTVAKDVTTDKLAIEAIRKGEQRFREVVETISEVFWVADPGLNRLVYVSPALEQLWGIPCGDAYRNPQAIGDLVHPDDKPAFLQSLQEQAKGIRTRTEYRVRRRDGTTRWVWDQTFPVLDAAGKVIRINAIAADITQRKHAEQALAESQQRLSAIVESAMDAIITLDRNHRIQLFNAAAERMFGWKAEDVLGMPMGDLLPERFREAHRRMVTSFAEGLPVTRSMGAGRQVFGRRRDGSEFPIEASISRVEVNQQLFLTVILRDVAERERSEQALRASEAAKSAILRSALDAIVSIDDQGRILDYNPAAERTFGWASPEVVGKPLIDLIIPEADRPAQLEGLTQYLTSSEARLLDRRIELTAIRSDGTEFPAELAISCASVDGKAIFTAFTRDLTEQRRVESHRRQLENQLRQAQKLEAIGTLAGGIAHDFNNILGAIIANVELAKMDTPDMPGVHQFLDETIRACDRAAGLIRQILTFSRQKEQERISTQIGPVVKEALKLLRSTIPRTIEFRTAIVSALPNVLADPTQVHQVVMNLCTNAWHAMEESGGTLEVRLEPVDIDELAAQSIAGLRPARYVRLTVADTGSGMDQATLDRIYEPFFTTKTPGKGTGLGLAVVHGIVQNHDGVIHVSSAPGKGTTFIILLPAVSAGTLQVAHSSSDVPRGNGESIMFVDDERPLVDVAQKILERLGYKVTGFTHPKEALDAFTATPHAFDLVVTDLTMPGMNGRALTAELLKVRPDMPIILATGFSGSFTLEEARRAGLRDLLMKPNTARSLGEGVRKALSGAHAGADDPGPT